MIISNLDRSSGFFSQFFFTINHYLYSIYTNQAFTLRSDTWLFKYKEGWTDYFMPIDRVFPIDNNVRADHVDRSDHVNIVERVERVDIVERSDHADHADHADHVEEIHSEDTYKIGWNNYFMAMDSFLPDAMDNNIETVMKFFYMPFVPVFPKVVKPVQINYIEAIHGQDLGNYKIGDYKTIIPEIYQYNSTMLKEIKQAQEGLSLVPNQYAAIFIRRGDKLVEESNYTHASKYLQKLLNIIKDAKQPSLDLKLKLIVYVQTDDYNCICELEEYIKQHSLNIKIITNCPLHCKGILVFPVHKYNILHNNIIEGNQVYVSNNRESLLNSTPVYEMNPDEIYEHTKKMIIGIELVRQARFVVTDYQSNVGRFIKLSMNDDRVFSVLPHERFLPNYEKILNPGFSF
jgi:hypothetical protein